MITAKINICGVAKRFPQKVSLRDKRRALNRAVLNYPDQLATYSLETTTTGKDLRVTRLTCNGGVNFRNRSDCWSQCPSQTSQLFSQCLFIGVSLKKYIYYSSNININIKRIGSVPKNVVPSQRLRQSKTHKTEPPFLSRV